MKILSELKNNISFMKNFEWNFDFDADSYINESLIFLILTIILIFSYVISIKNTNKEKLSPYECGFEPYDDAASEFEIKFYIYALMFLIFDLETIFLFLICEIDNITLDLTSFVFFDFLVELYWGFIVAYLWGAFDFN